MSLDFCRISKTLFSIIKEGGIVKKVRLFVLDFEIERDGTVCLRPVHTKIFTFFIFFVTILYDSVIFKSKRRSVTCVIPDSKKSERILVYYLYESPCYCK